MQYGRYRIIKELGKGTMGVVYQAHDPQIDRLVALKILRPDRVMSEAFVNRFLKEARAIGRLSHSGIVTIYDVGEDHNTIYIAMEFLEGEPFNDVVHSGRLTAPQSIQIAQQVALALDYAHGKGIVHRDIKPSNIILTADNQAKLTDFGIARIEDAAAMHQTQAGEILGTPVYMSPEQVMGQTVDGRSDLYSLGVILYEMIAGKRPFAGNSLASIFNAITQDIPEAPADIDPFISKPLSELIMKAIAKTPAERFQTGREMAAALAGLLQDRIDAEPVEKGVSQKRSSLVMMISALTLLVLMAGGGTWFFARDGLFRTQEKKVPVEDTQSQTAVDESQPKALLKISSEPSGAQIYIDSLFKGNTPQDLDLPLGKYELRLNLPEYLEWEAQIDLDEPGEEPLHVPLRPLKPQE